MHIEVVVDASVWVSSFRPEDDSHDASRFWAEQYNIKGGLLVAPMLLLIEVAAAISRRTGDPKLAKEAIKKLESANTMHTVHLVPIDAVLIQAAVEVATDLQLRAGDAIYVALAHQLKIPLVSWDKEQLQRSESLISTYTPDNYTFQEIHEEE